MKNVHVFAAIGNIRLQSKVVLIGGFNIGILYKLKTTFIEPFQIRAMEKKYADDANFDPKHDSGMVHIWGLTSPDDLSGSDANLYTMNDIDLIYFEDTKDYSISVEAIYQFNSQNGDIVYIRGLLDKLTAWMKTNGYDTDYKLSFLDVFTEAGTGTHYKTIPETYANFKLMVDGYCNMRN